MIVCEIGVQYQFRWRVILHCNMPLLLQRKGTWIVYGCQWLKSLALGRCGWSIELVILKVISKIGIWSISWEIALRWMPKDLTGDFTTLTQVLTWSRQKMSPKQRLPNFIPYGVTRPQWAIWTSECKLLCGVEFGMGNKTWVWLVCAI